jgi:hypothetical protein
MIKGILKSDAFRIFASWLVTQYVRLAWATGRWTVHGGQTPAAKWDAQQPFILVFWHGRLLMMPKSWRQGVKVHMLISQHRDGELITRGIKPFGIDTIRGSTSKPGKAKDKGGLTALREILRTLKSGECIGITPDGPKGPRMRASDGVITIARLSGAPILPAAWSARRRWALNSWDRFLVPSLFTKGVIVWGAPIEVPRDANDAQIDALRQMVEARMIALTDEADALAGAPKIEPAPALPREAVA